MSLEALNFNGVSGDHTDEGFRVNDRSVSDLEDLVQDDYVLTEQVIH